MALWMRQDGDAPNLAFATMQSRQIKGTNDWTEYLITMPFHRDAKQLFFGVLLGGTGKVWADDLQLLVDGKPVWDAPKVERPKTPLDLDQQFDAGSGIVISDLSPAQIENLAMLGKVWGFLKYHHPAVTTGTRHWDYELFRVLPARPCGARSPGRRPCAAGLDAASRDAAAVRFVRARPRDENVHLRADLGWMDTDRSRDLAELLRAIHRGRSQGTQFYVSQVPNIGNPQFDHEPPYASADVPGRRLSAPGDSTGSGTSSSTGFRIGTSWMKTGTRSSPNSFRGSRSRRTRTPTSSRRLRSSPE